MAMANFPVVGVSSVVGFNSFLNRGVVIGNSTIIRANSYVGFKSTDPVSTDSCSIGNNCVVGIGSIIKHNTTIGNSVAIGDNCMIGTGVTIQDGVTVPSGAVIADGLTITTSTYIFSVSGDVPQVKVYPHRTTDGDGPEFEVDLTAEGCADGRKYRSVTIFKDGNGQRVDSGIIVKITEVNKFVVNIGASDFDCDVVYNVY